MIIIPARMASNRFPNKILANINGFPMVIATAKRVEGLDKVVIATDSQKLINLAYDYGFDTIMTGDHHQSGTDRINEAATKLDIHEDEIIVNVQADEPFIEPEVVQSVINRVKSSNCFMASCYKLIGKEFANDPNHVKVITDVNENAIYFSRSKIPFEREEHLEYFGHLGIYGFTKKSLKEFCELSPAPLENIEKLEQLRAIYHGKKIAMVRVESESFGIDTKDDLEKALAYFKT
ncbi:MAG TPA: 3-deoxy-manno-octulosonate cytidylyltransferase [Sulfurospirillum arcachonense]|nr:3-deoxy-manno-octulosonate cytidylyltransferase [Sulfurospirillum arcachonense]HIP44590.1 3-deoxy-manno-octulosonate cytidylyltransferase [Sulfurospirillum arcachonense]